MNELITIALALIAVACDSIRDKRKSGTYYPQWHKLYKRPNWVPRFIMRKFQDRWHIAKQISFLLPHAIIAYHLPLWCLPIYVIGGSVAWVAVKSPDWWNK